MTIGKNLIIISTLLFSFFITNITNAVESNEEFATEKPSIKLHKKSGQSKNMAEDFVRKNKKWKKLEDWGVTHPNFFRTPRVGIYV